MVHRVPAGLNAAHVGFIFIDVVGNGHFGAPSRDMLMQPGLSMPILFPTLSLVAGSSRGHPECASSLEAAPGEPKTFTCTVRQAICSREATRLLLLLPVVSQKLDPRSWAAGKPGGLYALLQETFRLSSSQN
jgi:hypothetical protein